MEREREEAARYRLRLVPRVSSVTCRSMVVSLPLFLVAAARGANRLPLFRIHAYLNLPYSDVLVLLVLLVLFVVLVVLLLHFVVVLRLLYCCHCFGC